MVEREDPEQLSQLFKAMSDVTRRRIMTQLVQEGPARVSDLASGFAMSLNAVSKHIKILEQAGLVRRQTKWREHIITAELQPIRESDAWFARLRSSWELRLDELAQVLEEGSDNGE